MKKNKDIIIGFIIGILIFGTVGVCAKTLIDSKQVTFNNSSSGFSSTNLQDAIDELYDKANVIEFKVGDYVQMTPTKTSFVIPKTLTGYSSDQTINPSELNLWRVIRKMDDGTFELISVYVSNEDIYFEGLLGYQNLVGTLNYIAKQYENQIYTVGSKYIGFNGQTEYITDTSKITQTTPPWSQGTANGVTVEEQGGGDTLQQADLDRVKTAIGLTAYKKNSNTPSYYWVANRKYGYGSPTYYNVGTFVANDNNSWAYQAMYVYNAGNFSTASNIKFSLRPMIYLKSKIKATGSGTAESPYVLN